MVCRECGAYNNDQLEYCKVCAAPLHSQLDAAAQYVAPPGPTTASAPSAGDAAAPGQEQDNQAEGRPAWGFVRAPRWPQPNFDMNAVEEPVSGAPVEEYRQEPYARDDYQQQPYQPERYQQQDYQPEGYEQENYRQQDYRPRDYQQEDYRQQDYQPEYRQQGGYQRQAPTRRFEPQPMYREDETPPVEPVGTIGGYEENAGYQGGGFGRAPQRSAVYSMEDDGDVSFTHKKSRRPGPSTPAQQNKPVSSSKGRNASQHSSKSRRSGGMNKNLLFYGAAGVLVVLILVFAGIIVSNKYNGIGNFFSSVFGGSAVTKDPTVEQGVSKDDGSEIFIVTIYARDNSTVRAQIGDKIKEGAPVKGKLVLNIAKAALVPLEPVDGPTAQVVPKIEVVTEDGEVIPLELPAEQFTVNVPVLNLVVSEPSTSAIAVANGKVAVAGTVNDSSVTVFVEDQPITVNADGSFQGEYQLPELGSYTLTLRAEKAGYQIARQTINVDYSVSEANVTVDPMTLRAAESAESVTVKGTIDAGASLSVTGPDGVTIDTPNVNAATGIFSFAAKLPAVGHYELTLNLSKDGVSSSKAIIVERAPKVADYKYYQFDYNRMKNEPNHTASYELPNSEITEILHAPSESEPYLLAKASVGGNEVVLEYRNAKYMSTIQTGSTRRPLGDYVGIDETTGLPKIYVWFIYDK